MGLLAGSAIGAGESSRSGYSIQRRYDVAYEQCMYAKGNLLHGQRIPYNASLAATTIVATAATATTVTDSGNGGAAQKLAQVD